MADNQPDIQDSVGFGAMNPDMLHESVDQMRADTVFLAKPGKKKPKQESSCCCFASNSDPKNCVSNIEDMNTPVRVDLLPLNGNKIQHVAGYIAPYDDKDCLLAPDSQDPCIYYKLTKEEVVPDEDKVIEVAVREEWAKKDPIILRWILLRNGSFEIASFLGIPQAVQVQER